MTTDAEWNEFLAGLPWLGDAEKLFKSAAQEISNAEQQFAGLMLFVETWGTEAMDLMVFAWVDQLGHALNVTAGPNARQFPPGEFYVNCAGHGIHDVEPAELGATMPVYEWVREMINARFRMDQAEWLRLRTQLADRVTTTGDLKTIPIYLCALLSTCAQTYRQARIRSHQHRAQQN
jgi:hypothetical protein